ncbi:hypothetical protein ES703_114623 [subsurface metagenome]
MQIDLNRLETELKEVAGNIRLKVEKHSGCRVSIRETDNELLIRINPKGILSERELNEVRQFCFSSLEC